MIRTPSAEPNVLRFAVVDAEGFAHVTPIETILSKPLVADVQPNVVRMPFSTRQKRLDDSLRGPASIELTMIFNDCTTAAALRMKAEYWHKVLQTGRYFITSEGSGIILDPGAHDINDSGPVAGLSTKFSAILVPADSIVYKVDNLTGAML